MRDYLVSPHCTPKGAFRGLSYQPRALTSGRDPVHQHLSRNLRFARIVIPTPDSLRPGLPSSAARVTQLSCVTTGWACTTFCRDQDMRTFPSARRFPLAHRQSSRAEATHLLLPGKGRDYVRRLALAPCMQFSLHTALQRAWTGLAGPVLAKWLTSLTPLRGVDTIVSVGLASRSMHLLYADPSRGPPTRAGSRMACESLPATEI